MEMAVGTEYAWTWTMDAVREGSKSFLSVVTTPDARHAQQCDAGLTPGCLHAFGAGEFVGTATCSPLGSAYPYRRDDHIHVLQKNMFVAICNSD